MTTQSRPVRTQPKHDGGRQASPLRLSELHPSLTQVTYEAIRNWIVTGRLEPGSRLVERTLGEELGVSRIPVRDALRRLQEDGLVEVYPRRGAVVASPTVRDVLELHDLRAAIEPLAARRAAERRTDENLGTFDEIVHAGTLAAQQGDWDEAHELNWAFHETVVTASANPHLLDIMPLFRHKLAWLDSTSSRARGVSAWVQHAKIVAAIRRGNGDLAAKLAGHHVEMGQKIYAERITDWDAPAHSLFQQRSQ